jgi:hypothetical protein
MPAEVDLTLPLPGLSPVCDKPIVARFDGGRLSSDGGILLLAEVERRLGIADRLARCIEDPRAPDQIRHGLAEMIRFRALAIAAGYPDANDCGLMRRDPDFKLAAGRLPETGPDLCCQPTMTRLENLPGTVALKRMMAAMVELFCDSFPAVPPRIVLNIDDSEDRAYGHPVQCASRQPLLHADPYLRGDDRQTRRGFPAPWQDAGRHRGRHGAAPSLARDPRHPAAHPTREQIGSERPAPKRAVNCSG